MTSRLAAIRRPGPPTELGPGDDAAVVDAPDRRVVATTDVLVDGRHFRRDWSAAVDVGHRAAAANLADIAAMGARPTALLVGLAVPADLPVEWVDGLTDGMATEARDVVGAGGAAGVDVVGGDVVRSDVLTIAVTALGDLEGRRPLTRSGARAGDVLAYAGRLGYAAAGLAVLGRGFRTPLVAVSAYRRPEPPYAAGPAAAELGATAMCDVSDGLIQDVGHVARASGVHVDIDPDSLDLPDRLREVGSALGIDPMSWLLTGGDDHALVATFPPDVVLPAEWTVIGAVNGGTGVTVGGREWTESGYEHF